MDESHRELPKKLGATRDRKPSDNNSTGRLDGKIYDMESCKYRGHALIINNYQFELDPSKYRQGWKADSDNLRDLFQFLKFEQLEHRNLNAQEMKEAIATFARNEKSLNASSLAVVIMTHGDDTSFFGVDGLKINPYNDVLLNFHRDYAPDLIEKPKLFIFQACRGNRQDLTQEVFAPKYESEALAAGATGGQPVQRKNVPLPNMLIVNAALPGYLAYRHTIEGSWLISDFCRIVSSKAREEHIADIITEVSRVLNDREAEAIQQIHPENLLSRKWFLFPRERLQHELRTQKEDRLEFVYTIPWLQTHRFSLTDIVVIAFKCSTVEIVEFTMEQLHNECLLENQSFLCSEMSLSDDLLTKLTECGVLTDDQLEKLENINSNTTMGAAVLHFLTEFLPRGGSQAFDLFLGALRASQQKRVADQLDKWLTELCSVELDTFGSLQDTLEHFAVASADELLNREQRLEHVREYAEHKNIDSALFESIIDEEHVQHLCDNPLNLTLLCLMREQDEQLPKTRTQLFNSIHNLIRQRASQQMHLTQAQVEYSRLRPLYQLAFKAHLSNKTVISESDVKNAEKLYQVGYLTKERKFRKIKFRFTHKTFSEFLAAKHIALMDPQERKTWLQGLRFTNYVIRFNGIANDDDFDVRQNEVVLEFLFGLMEENPKELVQMASLVMQETYFSSKPHSTSDHSECGASHQLIRLIGQLNDVPPELGDVIIKGCPLINISLGCSASCRRGILKLGNLRLQPPIPLNVDLGFFSDEEEISFVTKSMECRNIECSQIWINPDDHTELWNIVSELRIGQADSFQQVSIDCDNIEGNPCEGFSFGDNLSGLELIRYKPWYSYLLEAALDKLLTSLHLIDCFYLEDRCTSLIHQLLHNQHLQSVQLMTWKQQQHFGRLFLADVAQLENLQSLEISLNDSTDEEMRSLKAILKRNKLSKLTIYSDYSRRLDSVLNDSFPSMSSLRELHLERVNITDLPNFRHLDLHSFRFGLFPRLLDLVYISLRPSTRNDNQIALLSDALRSWCNLQELRIDFDQNVSVAKYSLRELFEAIAGCHRLQILHFDHLEIGDSVVHFMCRMIESLKQLKKFTSYGRRNDSLTEEGFEQLEPIL
ncbi:hypothetical protein CAPTEDRAFT_202182 [Capitella teleta]|uniref:Caspase family p20 domain-containing protein n=1 Tax=Capitella teleta TaxID=283909 RepID=R7TKJ8_CAPTE|nr:hypothetical protein CAPTEDRAFT_202182 [Capitella teleta]|eukprot:ELT91645.1 hypothetical protein CAPTEDRAFT_202182 [Capitella teleta]